MALRTSKIKIISATGRRFCSDKIASEKTSDPYRYNKAVISEGLEKRIAEKFERLKQINAQSQVRMKPPKAQTKRSIDSLNFYQQNIFPLKRKNTRLEKMTKKKIANINWYLYLNDRVRVIEGPCKGQSGTVVQFFKERNAVVVKGVNTYRDDVPRLIDVSRISEKKKKKSEIYSVEVPLHPDVLRHFGLEISVVKLSNFDDIPLREKDYEELRVALKKALNICKLCAELHLDRVDEHTVIISITAHNKDCIDPHKNTKKISTLIGSIIPIEKEDGTTNISINSVIVKVADNELLNVKKIHVPKIPFTPGTKVISMHDEHFSKKGTVTNNFLNEIYVQFENEQEKKGPFSCFLFKAIKENEKLIKNYHYNVHLKRVVVLNNNDDIFQFSHVQFRHFNEMKKITDTFMDPPKPPLCEYLCTSKDEATKVTYVPEVV